MSLLSQSERHHTDTATGETLSITFAWIVVFGIALYVRIMPYASVFVGNEVRFDSNDSYLHVRRILLTVSSFPSVANFDNYNGFPNGMMINWPPLWDFTVSALALTIGLGHPTEQLVLRVAALFPVLIGMITLIPLAYFSKNVFGPRAVWPTLMVAAVFPAIYQPASLGDIDHHGGVIFFVVSILALAAWVLGDGAEKLYVKRTFYRFILLLGLAIAGSLLTWLGFVFFLGFVWAFFFTFSLITGRKNQNTVRSVGVAYLIAALIVLPFGLANPGFTFTYLSLFQVIFLVGTGASLLAVGSFVSSLKLTPLARVTLTTMTGTIVCIVIWTLAPSLRTVVTNGLIKAFALYPWAQETSEWQSLFAPDIGTVLLRGSTIYGKAFLLLPVALALVAFWQHKQRSYSAPVWFFYVWTFVATGMAIQAVAYNQMYGSDAAVLLGVGTLAAGDIFSLYFGHRLGFLRNQTSSASIPFVIALTLFTGSGIFEMQRSYQPAFHELLLWIRNNTPATSGFYNTAVQPEYGILSDWDYGDDIVAVARRPAVVNGNHEMNLNGFVLEHSIFQSNDEDFAVRLMAQNRIRYVLVAGGLDYVDGDLLLAGPPDSSLPRGQVPTLKPLWSLPPEQASSLVYSRLAGIKDENTIKPLSHFRLLHIGTDGSQTIYFYELVNGAKITGKTDPGKHVYASLPIRSTSGSQFTIRFETVAGADGIFEFTLPYMTSGKMGDTTTAGGYTITDRQNLVILQLSDKQVTNGEKVEISFAKSP